jgi:hypothetical protein
MTPESSFEMDDMEFEKELKGLGKKEFLEFRKKFREFSSEITQKSSFDTTRDPSQERASEEDEIVQKPLSYKDQLRIISSKLHLLKKEFEKREIRDRVHERIKEMLKTPEEMLHIDDPDFREAIHHMESKEFHEYLDHFKKIFTPIINNRKKIVQLNATNTPFDKQQRDNLKIIKRWDLIEEEMNDREKRVANA